MIELPSPKKMMPTPGIVLETAHADFAAVAHQVQSITGASIRVPPFGAIPLEDFLKIQLLHGAHHLSFLKPVE